jgi:hypothetical protein
MRLHAIERRAAGAPPIFLLFRHLIGNGRDFGVPGFRHERIGTNLETRCGRNLHDAQDREVHRHGRVAKDIFHGAEIASAGPRRVRRVGVPLAQNCEICGREGRLFVNRGWLATACPEHAAGDPAPVRPGFENILLVRRTPGGSDVYVARYDRKTDTLTEVTWPGTGPEE